MYIQIIHIYYIGIGIIVVSVFIFVEYLGLFRPKEGNIHYCCEYSFVFSNQSSRLSSPIKMSTYRYLYNMSCENKIVIAFCNVLARRAILDIMDISGMGRPILVNSLILPQAG